MQDQDLDLDADLTQKWVGGGVYGRRGKTEEILLNPITWVKNFVHIEVSAKLSIDF